MNHAFAAGNLLTRALGCHPSTKESLTDALLGFVGRIKGGLRLIWMRIRPPRVRPRKDVAMPTVAVTAENLETLIEANDLVLLDFWAEWCGPCRSFGPVFETISEEFPNAVFGKIDTEDQQALAASFAIQSIPTLMVIREQVVIFSQAGALPEGALRDLVTQAVNLDMTPIHEEIAQVAGNEE